MPKVSVDTKAKISISGALQINVLKEKLLLLPQRAIFWCDRKILFIADAHFGKAATFRLQKIAIPSGTTQTDLNKLEMLVDKLDVGRIIFLGDFIHSSIGMTERVTAQLLDWRKSHSRLSISLIKGNHDRAIGKIADLLDIEILSEPHLEAPFSLCHHPNLNSKTEKSKRSENYVLCGHLHPAIKLFGPARQKIRLPCFYFGEKEAVLPAFGTFTGSMEIVPGRNEKVFAIADGVVVGLK